MNRIEKVVFANGCFWCTEAVFQRIEGVDQVTSGYTGGHVKNPGYREVCAGTTGHAEAILASYNPSIVSFDTLLEVFFATHDPTTLNRQGNDIGTQYRSEIFFTLETQRQKSEAFVEVLNANNVFSKPIVTAISPLGTYYEAGQEHYDYYNQNKEQPYCQFIIAPKVEKIKQFYSEKLKL